MHRRLRGLHRVELVVHRRGRAGQVVDLVDFHEQREGDVVAHQLELRMGQQVDHVVAGAGEEVVDAEHRVPVGQQPATEVRADEAGTAGDQRTSLGDTHADLLHLVVTYRPACSMSPRHVPRWWCRRVQVSAR